MNPVIIIPAYNPPKNFLFLIEKILELYTFKIIIVDDGSNKSISIKNINVKILVNSQNYGKGYSLVRAFNYASEQGFTHALTLDADFQHDPKYISEMIEIKKSVDIVIGARKFNSKMPYHRKISNLLTSYIISYFTNTKVIDSQSGYRRYRLNSIINYNYIERGFQFETEVLLKVLSKKQSSLSHIQISTIYNSNKSHINNIKDTVKFIRLIIRFIFYSI